MSRRCHLQLHACLYTRVKYNMNGLSKVGRSFSCTHCSFTVSTCLVDEMPKQGSLRKVNKSTLNTRACKVFLYAYILIMTTTTTVYTMLLLMMLLQQLYSHPPHPPLLLVSIHARFEARIQIRKTKLHDNSKRKQRLSDTGRPSSTLQCAHFSEIFILLDT